MGFYSKELIEELNKEKERFYMPQALFDTMEYKVVRLELKWAFVACLNTLLDHPCFDKAGNGYIKDDNPQTIENLKILANKKVDQAKIDGYLKEMEDYDLITRDGRNIYIKRIENIF